MTFAQLKQSVREKCWPEGEAENLVALHTAIIVDGLIDLQRYVDCFRQHHVDVISQNSTYFQCGLTVVDRPDGVIKRVGTTNGSDFCTYIPYQLATYQRLKRWAYRFGTLTSSPLNTGKKILPLSYKFAESSSDSEYGRALQGLYAIDENGKLFIAPWIQSTEQLIVEWSGIKRTFNDSDTITWGDKVIKCVMLYAQTQRPQDFAEGKDMLRLWMDQWHSERADLMRDCRQEMNLIDATVDASGLCDVMWIDAIADENPDDIIDVDPIVTPTPDEEPVPIDPNDPTPCDITMDFAVVSDTAIDGASSNADAIAVANLVRGVSLHRVIHCGDMATDGEAFDAEVGYLYGKYMYPYGGATESYGGESPNHFYPAIGNHDISGSNDYLPFQQFIQLPNTGRYYDFVLGACHFFVLNSNSNDPDGVAVDSDQYKWFVDRVSRATAPWKIVVMHSSPYASDSNHGPGNSTMRWDFAAKGIDIVYSGDSHIYERLIISGVTYVVAGTGGSPLYTVGSINENSVIQYAAKHGACFATATCDSFVGRFINVDSETIDTFTLTK